MNKWNNNEPWKLTVNVVLLIVIKTLVRIDLYNKMPGKILRPYTSYEMRGYDM